MKLRIWSTTCRTDGRALLADVSFRVGEGASVALVGPNGAGKTTLLRLISGELAPDGGAVKAGGGLGVMPQFVGVGTDRDDERTVRDLLVSVAPPAIRKAAEAVDAAELAIMEAPSDEESTQLAYAQALADWAEVQGYEAETLWDKCTTAALGVPYERAQWRTLSTLSGGEQKRLVLESLLRGNDEVLLLDEPDNYLDVPGKRWLEQRLQETRKTVLFISHDRELLAVAADKIVSVEPSPAGAEVWVHGGGFGSYHKARQERFSPIALRAWEVPPVRGAAPPLGREARTAEEARAGHAAVRGAQPRDGLPLPGGEDTAAEVRGGGPAPGAAARAADRDAAARGPYGRACRDVRGAGADGPDEAVQPGGLLRGTGRRARLWGHRPAVAGGGSGKSHFLRLLAGGPDGGSVAHTGSWKLGARVVPGHFAQTHAHPELAGRTLLDVLWTEHAKDKGAAMSALRRYEMTGQAEQPFDRLSGGQQARFQILLLELAGTTALLLDEPTDNLDLESAEGLEAYEGTVLAVTHDRWFARSFDRFLVFGADGVVRETPEAVWGEGRVRRSR